MAGDKLVVFGTMLADAPRTDSDYVMLGLTSTGAVDSAFGKSGRVVVDLGNSGDSPRNVTVQPDGKIVATGYSNINGVVQPVLIRVTGAGVLDPAFGKEGVATARVLPGAVGSTTIDSTGRTGSWAFSCLHPARTSAEAKMLPTARARVLMIDPRDMSRAGQS